MGHRPTHTAQSISILRSHTHARLACAYFSLRVLSIFFCLYSPRALYILANILEYREYFCHSAGRRRQKIAPNIRLSPQNRPGSLKTQRFQPASTQNLLLRGKRAVPRSSSQDRSRRRDCNIENIQEYLETRGQPRSRAEESSYILEKKAGRGIYILENIIEYESARDPLYSQRYSRKTCKGQPIPRLGLCVSFFLSEIAQ